MVAIFQSWRLRLREVEAAVQLGRLDEALHMLTHSGLLEYLPAKRIAEKLALRLAERARRRAKSRDDAGGWKDLEAAVALADVPACDVARRCLVEAALEETEALTRRGHLHDAAAQLDRLEKHALNHPRVQTLRQLVRCLQSARNLSRRGKFGDAEAHLNVALGLRPEMVELQQLREDCRVQSRRLGELSEKLYRAMSEPNHQEALSYADQLLVLAPELRLAQEARKRAWHQVGARLDSPSVGSTHVWGRSTAEAVPEANNAPRKPRFLLWVDGVGGYLVCLGDEVLLGQAAPGNLVDIPILGDLSRKHAKVHRSGEGYLIEPVHGVRVNNKAIEGTTNLCDGDELELGTGVRFRFRRPHALSASARLDPISRHRTQPYADGVLLMAESCVLGPKWTNHVVCRDWSSDVVLFQTDGELYCQAGASLEIDGRLCDGGGRDGRGRLEANSRVIGTDFSLSLEELDKCLRQPLV